MDAIIVSYYYPFKLLQSTRKEKKKLEYLLKLEIGFEKFPPILSMKKVQFVHGNIFHPDNYG